ncbi:UNVERIFIED_CONTAM: hypothetical protein NCL1_10295 [Trichonephila clavipes]
MRMYINSFKNCLYSNISINNNIPTGVSSCFKSKSSTDLLTFFNPSPPLRRWGDRLFFGGKNNTFYQVRLVAQHTLRRNSWTAPRTNFSVLITVIISAFPHFQIFIRLSWIFRPHNSTAGISKRNYVKECSVEE